jgi:hypothetical protein
MTYKMTYDQFRFITIDGIALDDNFNELRDEDGAIFVVPEEDRGSFIIATTVDQFCDRVAQNHEAMTNRD